MGEPHLGEDGCAGPDVEREDLARRGAARHQEAVGCNLHRADLREAAVGKAVGRQIAQILGWVRCWVGAVLGVASDDDQVKVVNKTTANTRQPNPTQPSRSYTPQASAGSKWQAGATLHCTAQQARARTDLCGMEAATSRLPMRLRERGSKQSTRPCDASRSISPPWRVNSISSGSPHVRPMGRTCGEPDEIKKNTHPEKFTALFRERTCDVPTATIPCTSLISTTLISLPASVANGLMNCGDKRGRERGDREKRYDVFSCRAPRGLIWGCRTHEPYLLSNLSQSSFFLQLKVDVHKPRLSNQAEALPKHVTRGRHRGEGRGGYTAGTVGQKRRSSE